jgi:hypothetical protein
LELHKFLDDLDGLYGGVFEGFWGVGMIDGWMISG